MLRSSGKLLSEKLFPIKNFIKNKSFRCPAAVPLLHVVSLSQNWIILVLLIDGL